MKSLVLIAALLISSVSAASVDVMAGGFSEDSITSTCNMMARFRLIDHINRGDVVFSDALNRYKRMCVNHWMRLNTSNVNVNQFRGLCELDAELAILSREAAGKTTAPEVKDRYVRMCFSKFERLNTAQLNYVLGKTAEVQAEQDIDSTVAL